MLGWVGELRLLVLAQDGEMQTHAKWALEKAEVPTWQGGEGNAQCNSQPVGKGVHVHLLHGVAHVQYMEGSSVGEHYEQATAVCPEWEVASRLRFRLGGKSYAYNDAMPSHDYNEGGCVQGSSSCQRRWATLGQ